MKPNHGRQWSEHCWATSEKAVVDERERLCYEKQARKHPLLSYGMKLSLVNSRAVLIPISYCALFSLQNILAILYRQISQTEF